MEITKLRRVNPSEKKKIIEVSVERLYKEAKEKGLDYTDRPGYTSSSHRFADENFMNSLRSDRNEEFAKSEQKKPLIGNSGSGFLSNSKLSFKPKAGQIRHGLVERPKRKFVKRIDTVVENGSSTPVVLKRIENSRINYVKSQIYSRSTSKQGCLKESEGNSTPPKSFNTPLARVNVMPPQRNVLEKKSPSILAKKKIIAVESNFDGNSKQSSMEKSKERSQKMKSDKKLAKNTSKDSSKLSTQSKSKMNIEHDQMKTEITHRLKSSKSRPKSTQSTKSKAEKASPDKKKVKKSTSLSSKKSFREDKREMRVHHKQTERTATDKQAILAVGNEGIDQQTTPQNASQQTFMLEPIKPTKPSNIVPTSQMPEKLAEEFKSIFPAEVHNLESSSVADLPLICEENGLEKIKRSFEGISEKQQEEIPERIKENEEIPQEEVGKSEASEPKHVLIDKESDEEFEFEDEDSDKVDVNAVIQSSELGNAEKSEEIQTTKFDDETVIKQSVTVEVMQVTTNTQDGVVHIQNTVKTVEVIQADSELTQGLGISDQSEEFKFSDNEGSAKKSDKIENEDAAIEEKNTKQGEEYGGEVEDTDLQATNHKPPSKTPSENQDFFIDEDDESLDPNV